MTVSEPILAAARRLAAQGRLGSATMQELATEAGLSRVTLYRQGATREAVLDALRHELAAAERELLWPAMTGPGTAAERLERALAALCVSTEDSLDLLAVLATATVDALYHEPGDEALTRHEFVAPLHRLLQDGALDGSLRADLDPDETATVLYNQVCWTYAHLRRAHRWSAERARGAVVRTALHGVAP